MPQANCLQVSINELTALLKRVFEAIACDQSAQDDAAKSIIALESRGLSALEGLPQLIERLRRENPKPLPTVREENNWLEIDGNHCSAACYGSVFTDLVAAYAKRRDSMCSIRVKACHEPSLILHALLSSAASGVAMLAYWKGGNLSDEWCAYLISSACVTEHYLELDSSDKNSSAECLNLIAATDVEQIMAQWQQIKAKGGENGHTCATDMQHRLEKSLRDGITIQSPLWQQLQEIAANVLVPSSERSRAGAGA